MRLMLTGANGQVGWELRQSLRPLGDVTALDRDACDLSRPDDLPRIVSDLKPNVIVNAAAYTAVDKAEAEEPLATVVNGTSVGILAAEARKHGALLVHYSTDYVFDGGKVEPYTEDDPPNPISAYGRSKIAGERAIAQAGGDYLILRTSWVYAARGRNFLRTVLRLARERDELRIVDDQIGAPTWARDIADGTAHIVAQARRELEAGLFRPGMFNLTAAGATSWHGFAKAILDLAASAGMLTIRPRLIPITTADYPTPAARPKNSRLSGDCLRQRFGFALADWRTALETCMGDPSFVSEQRAS